MGKLTKREKLMAKINKLAVKYGLACPYCSKGLDFCWAYCKSKV